MDSKNASPNSQTPKRDATLDYFRHLSTCSHCANNPTNLCKVGFQLLLFYDAATCKGPSLLHPFLKYT